jgi:hypothetical protein
VKPLPPLARLPLLLLGMLALVVGVLAGLARLAVGVPDLAAARAGAHGALMIAAFLGTVISLERAVALAATGRNWPYLAPLAAALAGLGMLIGWPPIVVQCLLLAAGATLLAGSLMLCRSPVLHLVILALAAGCYLVGHLSWLVVGHVLHAVPWWMAFLVLTIAGERLELTRFMVPSPLARRIFVLLVALQVAGLVFDFMWPETGLRLFAAALLGLALWLLRQDIARRTVRQAGLTRYIAVCLLLGYGWLLLGGMLGMAGAFAVGHPLRDAALHAVLLGFVFSMIFGHAPIIFPAVAKVRIPYHPAFYLPLALLHLSLLGRVIGDFAGHAEWIRHAALANALALLLFILTLITRVLQGLRQRTGR